MPIDDLQKPNIGTPDYAEGRTNKKLWAILTTLGFAVFWIYLLYMAATFFGGDGISWYGPVICLAGLALGLVARRKVDRG